MLARGAFLARRMGAVRLLLASVLVSTLAAASLVAALTGFAVRSLPQAVGGNLARSPGTSVAIYGEFGDVQAGKDQRAVPAAVRAAFGAIPFTQHEALWSDSIGVAARGRTITVVLAAALTGIAKHARLTAGAWPAAVAERGHAARGTVIQAAVPATVASALHVQLGQLLVLRDRLTGALVRFRLTGLYRPRRPTAPYWGVDLIAPSGISVQPGFVSYGPLVVARSAFTSGGLTIGGATWLVTPEVRRITQAQLAPLATRLSQLLAALRGSPGLGGLQVSSGLPEALRAVAASLVVARSLLAVCELELLLLAAATLALAASTLASQREDEQAMLAARGSGRWQLMRLALVEALLVNLVAAIAGALLGSLLAERLGGLGALRSLGLAPGGVPVAAWLAVGAVLVLCTVIMVWPALRPVTPGAARVRRGRRAMVSAAARAGGDVSLLLLALAACWELRQNSVVGRTAGGLAVDPVLALAPAIALAAATVVPLRLLPALASGADRLASRTRRLGLAMTSWEISRRAARQSAPMLLVVLCVGTGTLALAEHASWHQSAADQAAFAAGAAVRGDLAVPIPVGRSAAITLAPGVRSAVAVSTSLAMPAGGQALALDAREAAATVLLRADQSALPARVLWRRIIPARAAAAIVLPGRPARLEIVASLGRGTGPGLGPTTVTASVQDAAGVVYSIPAGGLRDDGRGHALIATLSRTGQAAYPLRLLAISLQYTLPPLPRGPRQQLAAVGQRAVFSVRGLAVSAAPTGGIAAPFASGQALARWVPAVSAPRLALLYATGQPPSLIGSGPPGSGPGSVTFRPGDGQIGPPGAPPSATGRITARLTFTAAVPFTVIPGIATSAFLRASHLAVGDIVQLTAQGAAITVRIAAVVGAFPTITSQEGGLIVDQAAAQDIVAAQSAPALPVTQWWLRTTGAIPPGLPAGLAVTSRARLLAGLESDPISAIPQQAVQSIAVAAALLAVLGFSVSVAGSITQRRSQSALLAALGVDRMAQARLLALEALALSLPAAATGLLLGIVLAHLLVPAVTLTAAATAPVPAAIVDVPLLRAVALALAVAAIPVIVATASAAYRPDLAARLRTAAAT